MAGAAGAKEGSHWNAFRQSARLKTCSAQILCNWRPDGIRTFRALLLCSLVLDRWLFQQAPEAVEKVKTVEKVKAVEEKLRVIKVIDAPSIEIIDGMPAA